MENSQMGKQIIQKQKKQGKPRILFTKHDIPEEKNSDKYQSMIKFLNEFEISIDEYANYLESQSETSILSTTNTSSTDTTCSTCTSY